MHTVVAWGDWVSAVLQFVQPLVVTALGLVVTWLATQIGGPIGGMVSTYLTRTVIDEAVNYGFGAINGAVKNRELDVNTNNAILNAATHYVVSKAPDLAAKYGDTLRATLFAKLSESGAVPKNASALDHGVRLPAPKG